MNRISKDIRILIRKALKEDIGSGDITTELLVPSSLRGRAQIDLKSKGIFSGGLVAREVFLAVDTGLKVNQTLRDGSRVSKPGKVMEIRGRISSILKAERVALNFLAHLSGIATLTNHFVRQAKGTRAKIFDTRKTTPLWRSLEKYAVRSGGGSNHRFGLWDEILVKDNHWQAIWHLLEKTHCRYFLDRLKKLKRSIPIEIEVDNLRGLKHLISGKIRVNRILLDNFSIQDLKKAVAFVRRTHPQLLLEASGGISLKNVRQVAKTGVDRISIGALTQDRKSTRLNSSHSAKSRMPSSA